MKKLLFICDWSRLVYRVASGSLPGRLLRPFLSFKRISSLAQQTDGNLSHALLLFLSVTCGWGVGSGRVGPMRVYVCVCRQILSVMAELENDELARLAAGGCCICFEKTFGAKDSI